MTLRLNRQIVAGLVILFVGFLVVGIFTVNANPSGFVRSQSAAATTTLIYLTPGTATSTFTVDTSLTGKSASAGDSQALLVQFTASSTASTLQIAQEYSMDGVDWYQGTQTIIVGNSTTTLPVSLTPVPQYSWAFASSTAGGGAVSSTNNLDTRIIPIVSPTRWTRFVFSMKLGGTNGGEWCEVVTKKQNP